MICGWPHEMNFELSYTAAEALSADSIQVFPNELLLTVFSQCAVGLSKLNLLIILGLFHLFIINCYWYVSDKKSIPLFTHLAGVKKECSSPAVEVVPAILTILQLFCMKSAGA